MSSTVSWTCANTKDFHKNSLLQLEALLFGQAGFLQKSQKSDSYFIELQKEYLFLRAKYHLEPIDVSLWKFLRLRPANFPTIRIAQFASLIQIGRASCRERV